MFTFKFPCPSVWCDPLCELLSGWPNVASVSMLYSDDDEHLPGEEVPYALEVHTLDAECEQELLGFLSSEAPYASVLAHPLALERRVIAEEDWAESWKQYWHVDKLSDRLVICPSWETYEPQSAEEIVLKLDPGMAFGTGTHASTRLMLQAMEPLLAGQADPNQLAPVLDLGTGSGILAIYAAKRGLAPVLALDIDPIAVSAATENARLNEVSLQVTVAVTPLEVCLVETPFKLALVNILANVIEALLPDLTQRMASGGIGLFAGLVLSQQQQVEDALKRNGWQVLNTRQQQHWLLIEAKKN
jgi:ribosomal protein L11 methyltransferase